MLGWVPGRVPGPGLCGWATAGWTHPALRCACMCAHTHTCVHVDTHTRIHTCTQTSEHTATCICTCTHLRRLAYAFTSMRVHTPRHRRAHTHTHTHTHTRGCAHTPVHLHAALLEPHSSPPWVCTGKPTHSPTTPLEKPALPECVAQLAPCTPATSQTVPRGEKQRRGRRVAPGRSVGWFSPPADAGKAGDPPAPWGSCPLPSPPASHLSSVRRSARREECGAAAPCPL